jgi:hypothetical protein
VTWRLPDSSERVSVVGRTGSGKTQMGAFILSRKNYKSMPWLVIDYKGDELLNSIPHIQELADLKAPTKPGLYVAHMHPADEDGIEKLLMSVWEKEHCGLFVDEGYMINRNSFGLQAILTQGRSKHIPAVVLSQRPVALSRFVFSEADHFSVFHLNHSGDRSKIEEYLPEQHTIDDALPDFHSYWYDVKRNNFFMLRPVPQRDKILEIFDEKLRKKRSFL